MDQLEAAQAVGASGTSRCSPFWTFGCINCQHNYPSLKAWQEKFWRKGVTIIGVHTPETAREREIGNVRKSADENGLTYPIIFDKDAKIWKTWDNRWWPSTYLIDKKGFVRYRWDGELNWKKTKGEPTMRRKIERLLAEPETQAVKSRDLGGAVGPSCGDAKSAICGNS